MSGWAGWLATACLAVGPAVPVDRPAKTPAPSAAALLAHYHEARGGKDQLDAIRGLRIEGQYATNGRPVDQRLLWRAPDRMRRERGAWQRHRTDVTVTEAFDGRQAWRHDPTADSPEPAPVAGDHTASLAREARVGPLLRIQPDETVTVALLGREETELGQAWHVTARHADGTVAHWYLDPDTHLPLSMTTERWDWGRVRPIRFYYSDWRPVDGVLFPFRIEDEFSSFHRMFAIERIDVLDAATIGDERFALPPPPAR